MTNIKTLLGTTSLLGLAVLALAGCPAEEPEKSEHQIICEQMVECKQVEEGRTVEECTNEASAVYDMLQGDARCEGLLEPIKEYLLCFAEKQSCDEIGAGDSSTASSSDDQPCARQQEALMVALGVALEQNDGSLDICMLPYEKAIVGDKAAAEQQQ